MTTSKQPNKKRPGETVAEYQHRWHKERQKAASDAYLAEHGEFPLCACGCGERVIMNQVKLVPNKYVHQHQPRDMSPALAKRHEDTIPLEDFVKAVKKLKEQKNWTWKEMAAAGGIHYGHFKSLVYSTGRRKTVGREWAREFFLRLSGAPAPQSTYERHQIQQRAARFEKVQRELDHAKA